MHLKFNEKEAEDEIFKLIVVHLPFFQCCCWLQLEAKFLRNKIWFYISFPEAGERAKSKDGKQ